MGTPFLRLALVLLGALLLGCETPVSDPAQPFRELITGRSWTSDPAYAATDRAQLSVYFYEDGRARFGNDRQGSWSYRGHTFTIQRGDESGVTDNPVLTASSFVFNFDGGVCHLYR